MVGIDHRLVRIRRLILLRKLYVTNPPLSCLFKLALLQFLPLLGCRNGKVLRFYQLRLGRRFTLLFLRVISVQDALVVLRSEYPQYIRHPS